MSIVPLIDNDVDKSDDDIQFGKTIYIFISLTQSLLNFFTSSCLNDAACVCDLGQFFKWMLHR